MGSGGLSLLSLSAMGTEFRTYLHGLNFRFTYENFDVYLYFDGGNIVNMALKTNFFVQNKSDDTNDKNNNKNNNDSDTNNNNNFH